MLIQDIKVGRKVRCMVAYSGVPIGTIGVIVSDYGSGIMVAWDLPDRPYPKNKTPLEVASMYAVHYECPLRDGFDKETELYALQII